MTVNQIHAAVVQAYREALADSEFEGIPIAPIDRETDDVIRPSCETDYTTHYGREMGMQVLTVNEELYFYPANPKKWKLECNAFETLIQERLLRGLPDVDVEINDIDSLTENATQMITFSVTSYEVADFDGRDTEAEIMEHLATKIEEREG